MSHSTVKMPSAAQIKSWKEQFKAIHKITPDPTRPEIFCIVRHPKLIDIVSSSELGGGDEIKIGSLQLTDCWLLGDERIKSDIELLRAASKKMGGLFKVYKNSVEYISVTAEILKSIPVEQIDRVKADGEVRKLTVIVPDETGKPIKKSAWLRKPDMLDVEKAETGGDPIAMGTIYLQECWLSGCKDLKEGEDEIRFAAYLAALGIFRRFTADVEKL